MIYLFIFKEFSKGLILPTKDASNSEATHAEKLNNKNEVSVIFFIKQVYCLYSMVHY